ncbi:uridine kinase [Amycolatopsis sp. QT-25]|uniref:uridine kinase family protein n=1 Tax=Amycolatopsis sp. QT-25 TaxID=3034022 RepID=UPI0023ED9D71|nr:uridine kinase [Amycolatopsis sp. QT-25]WET79292.1 uridine kinase [Amycolatopsis sp. QT-25]
MLAVDGPSGSGKSTLAGKIVAELGGRGIRVVLVSTDEFATWDEPVSWWPRLETGVLEPLRAGRPGRYRRVDWAGGTPRPGEEIEIPVPDVAVLEGVSSGRARIRPSLSLLTWLDGGSEAERLDRATGRDGEDSRAHLRRWQLFERGWFAVDGTRAAADRVLTSHEW